MDGRDEWIYLKSFIVSPLDDLRLDIIDFTHATVQSAKSSLNSASHRFNRFANRLRISNISKSVRAMKMKRSYYTRLEASIDDEDNSAVAKEKEFDDININQVKEAKQYSFSFKIGKTAITFTAVAKVKRD